MLGINTNLNKKYKLSFMCHNETKVHTVNPKWIVISNCFKFYIDSTAKA